MKSTASQTDRLLSLLKDFQPHRTDEIRDKVYGEGCCLARIGARIHDLKKDGWMIDGWRDPKNRTLYYYRLTSFERMKHAVNIPKIIKRVNKERARYLKAKQFHLFESKIYTDY